MGLGLGLWCGVRVGLRLWCGVRVFVCFIHTRVVPHCLGQGRRPTRKTAKLEDSIHEIGEARVSRIRNKADGYRKARRRVVGGGVTAGLACGLSVALAQSTLDLHGAANVDGDREQLPVVRHEGARRPGAARALLGDRVAAQLRERVEVAGRAEREAAPHLADQGRVDQGGWRQRDAGAAAAAAQRVRELSQQGLRGDPYPRGQGRPA